MAQEKIAAVTGAGSGVGKQSALALLREGYSVAIAGRRADALQSTVSEAGEAGRRCLAVPTDVADPAAVDALFAKIKETFGRLDVLFNNAGVNAPGIPFEDLTFEQWQRVVDINLTGAFLCAQGRIPADEGAEAAWAAGSSTTARSRRTCRGPTRRLTPPPSTRSPASPARSRWTAASTTSACGQIDIGNAATEMATRMKDGVPQADGSIAVEPLMDVQHVARAVVYMANLPLDANVQFMTVMATKMPFIGRG